MRNAKRFTGLLAACALTMAHPASSDVRPVPTAPVPTAATQLGFIANQGQIEGPAVYYARTSDCAAFFEPGSILLDRSPGKPGERGVALRVSFPNGKASVEAADPRGARVSTFLGSDPRQWRSAVETFGEVRYHAIAPGADLVYRMAGGRLKYDCVLEPGVDPARAVLRYQGAERLELAADGGLLIHTGAGTLYEQPPALYQEVAGRRVPVRGGYQITGSRDLSFWATGYDPTLTLVVDPSLLWSTFLGGDGADKANAVTTDGNGNLYVVGETASSNFVTTPGVYSRTRSGSSDVFVTKLSPDGASVIWSTLLGGLGLDVGRGVALDASGNVYVCGQTASSNFPVTSAAFQRTHGGDLWDAFVAKLSPTGAALLYATYLGGNAADYGVALRVDAAGCAVVGGITGSSNYPTTAGVVVPGFSPSLFDAANGFVTKLNAAGSAPVFSTYIGTSNGVDMLNGLALDNAGQAVVVGWTVSASYPTTAGAYDRTFTGASNTHEAFVTKLNGSGTAYVFSTFLGGSQSDDATGVALDAQGKVYVTGRTLSGDFPVSAGAFDASFDASLGNYWDGFVCRLSADGAALEYGTYFGGSNHEEPYGIAVGAGGQAVVCGYTSSSGFPATSGACDASYNGGQDAFLLTLAADGRSLLYATFLGASGTDLANAVTVNPSGQAVVVGATDGAAFPTTSGAYDTGHNSPGSHDSFVAALGVELGASPTAVPGSTPDGLQLAAPAPNPFQSLTSLSLTLPGPDDITVRVLDIQGREVITLAHGTLAAGQHRWTWDGTDTSGNPVGAGRYFLDVAGNGWNQARGVVRLR